MYKKTSMDSFYMFLPSNSSPDTQPNNDASKYIVDYENSINFHGTWQVAMTDVMIFYTPSTIRKGSYIKYLHNFNGSTTETVSISRKGMILEMKPHTLKWVSISIYEKKLYIKSKYVFEVAFAQQKEAEEWGFKSKFNSVLKGQNEYILYSANELLEQNVLNTTLSIKVQVENGSIWEKFVFNEDVALDSSEKVVTYLKTHCKDIFKTVTVSKDHYLSLTLNDTIRATTMNRHLAMVLGFTKPMYSHTDATADSPLKLNKAFNQIYIYSSIVEPILVGSDRVPLLRSVWIDSTLAKYGQPISYTPKHLMYLPISSTCINKIEVNIRDDSGAPILSSFGAKTILTLHFKKIHD